MTRLKLDNGNPAAILRAAKRAALSDGWTLAQWTEFSDTARACLTPDCDETEHAKFLDVVRERFDVVPSPSFDDAPASWTNLGNGRSRAAVHHSQPSPCGCVHGSSRLEELVDATLEIAFAVTEIERRVTALEATLRETIPGAEAVTQ